MKGLGERTSMLQYLEVASELLVVVHGMELMVRIGSDPELG